MSSAPAARDSMVRVKHSLQSLTANYASLLRLTLKIDSAEYAQQIVSGLVGLLCLFVGWALFVGMTMVLLAPGVPYWVSLGAWAVIHFIFAAILFWRLRSTATDAMPSIRNVGVAS